MAANISQIKNITAQSFRLFVLTINRMLASSVFKKTKGTGSASNKALKTTPFGRSDAFTRGGFAIMPHANAPLSLMLCCGVNVDSYGRNKLHNLIIDSPIAEHPAGIKELVDKGINVNAQDINGWSALHFAVQERSYTAVKALLENGADTDLLESNGNSALHKAVFYSNNNNDIISLLLVYGANPDTVNNHGVTPRSLAQVVENSSIVALFNKCNITKN